MNQFKHSSTPHPENCSHGQYEDNILPGPYTENESNECNAYAHALRKRSTCGAPLLLSKYIFNEAINH